jgi:NAD(P)H-hydrate epimerase
MAGAVALAGMGALRGGAGWVKVAVPDVCLETVAGYEPSYITVALPSDVAGRIALAARERIVSLAERATAVALGPGLGRSDELVSLVGWLYENLSLPMVIDADGLNALADLGRWPGAPAGPRILTPHPGEFSRLVNEETTKEEERVAQAIGLAGRLRVVVVLKGHRTLMTDGQVTFRNTTGNPGMATGGSGDVLTGLITALLCQGLAPLNAARLAVHVHGLAGDLAAEAMGQVSMIARDLVQYLPAAFQKAGAR